MAKKAEIIVEQFDRGITLRWNDAEGMEQSSKSLAVSGQEATALGTEIWNDVKFIIDSEKVEMVKIHVEYELMK